MALPIISCINNSNNNNSSSTAPSRPRIDIEELKTMSSEDAIASIQSFINQFQYNFSGKPFIKMKKNLGPSHVFSCAQEIIDAALPIQCVEATFIALYLTCGLTHLTRVPLSFKSYFEDGSHRHMVLALQTEDGLWGAVGISRRPDLMDKPLIYASLYDLIVDYKKCFNANFHRLSAVYFGSPFTHSLSWYSRGTSTDEPSVQWKEIRVKLPNVLFSSQELDRKQELYKLKHNRDVSSSGSNSSNLWMGLSVRERCTLFTQLSKNVGCSISINNTAPSNPLAPVLD